MSRIFFIILIFLFKIQVLVIAQSTLTGIVIDSDNQSFLPFVNIGIRHKNIGTSSLTDGTFSIQIPQQNENDTLTFSMVGYSELILPIKNIIKTHQKTFLLKIKPTQLNTVTVSARKLIEKKIGIIKNKGLINFTDGSTNQNDIFEIAQLIKLDSTSFSKITSLNLHINGSREDSGVFRINFYSLDGKKPSNRIIEKSIIQTHEIQAGWLKFDLAKYNIYLKGDFVIGLEFIPTTKKNNPIYYAVKLGGSSKSFVRTSSQGDWRIPPHHYRFYITALVTDKKNKKIQDDSDDKETIPSKILFSKFVNDSFSIFISLPKDYDKKKKQHFPVAYLLDANAYFDIVNDAINENKIKNIILVGVGYKDAFLMDSLRNRDYTFPKALAKDSFPISGGGDKFLEFMEQELIPFIDKTYRSDTSNRTLMGHSFGGYFTLFALNKAIQSKVHLFNNYVAASPTLYFFDNYLPKQFLNISNNIATKQQNLFITSGASEDIEGNNNFKSFIRLLSDSRFKNMKLKYEIYPNFGHMETAVPTFTKAIQEIK